MVARPHVRFLATDIWDTPDDGNRYEVIDGELYVTPPPVVAHQYPSGQLYGSIWSYLQTHPTGLLFSAPIGVILGINGGVQPDLVYVANEHRAIITDQGIEGAPDLVVEILSPSTQSRDRGIKFRGYAAAGVTHYWIVDPRQRTLETYRLGDEGYGQPTIYRDDAVFQPDLFPGLAIQIGSLFI
jgi:Uma2 family endonuclease